MKMQGDDPPFLPVGTDVSAKYKGAFCEAKIKKVVRNIKCRLSLKVGGGVLTVTDEVIKGTLRVGNMVEVKQDPKKDAVEAIITKIQDCSQYTVVFDDGDITTLRRSALCLKSGRHFNESETLDQLPLTHPEHFSTPVIAGRRGRRGRALSDESSGSPSSRGTLGVGAERERHVGRVVLVEAGSGAERRRPQQPAFPALVVAPTPQINLNEDYLVRSFKDGRYYTVPKKEAREFRKGGAPAEWAGVDAALQYLNNGVLPPHWDRDALFNDSKNTSDDSSDDEPREEKDHFVAQLYKFMDDRGTPLNRNPTIANKDIDLYRLFRVTQKLGGYNRVSNQNQWKNIADKMGFHPVTTSITNLCKQSYKKYLHSFEDFYRKLGVTLVAHPRGARTPPAGRSLIRDRDKQIPTSSSASSTPTGTPQQRGKDREKESDKSETDRSEKEEKEAVSQAPPERKEKIEKPKETKSGRTSDGEDSADNQPLVGPSKIDKEKEKEKEKERERLEKEKEIKDKEKEKEKEREEKKEKEKEMAKEKEIAKEKEREKVVEEKPPTPIVIKPRSQSKTRSLPLIKTEVKDDKRTPKPRRPTSSKGEGAGPSTSRASRRPHVSTDSDSSGRASRCGMTKKMQSRRSQSANSASSGNTIASNSSKRPRKRKNTEPSANEPPRVRSNVKAQVGDKLQVYYGPIQSESKVTYEAKVIEISAEGMLRVHYTGWNTRYDEWIKPQSIAVNVTQRETTHNKKGMSNSRRVRPKRTEGSSARSDSDSDTDSEVDVKRLPKKSIDDKASGSKTPSRPKESKSSDSSSSAKPRKRPARPAAAASPLSPAKKPRVSAPHQGRDYDLNEIRSELKGLHTVKQEPEEIKQEVVEKEPSELENAPQPDKQAEDVYEFKEPEPFELELHDEKKKRTHRIFDDISPSKYTSTLSKSLSEEISEDPLRARPPLRSPSLSPFRDFSARETAARQSPEDDSKDGIFSLDDDSFPGDGSSGPIFEGFTPAKNQETYSKKSKVSKLMKLIDDSPDSPADDEQSSDDDDDDDDEDVIMKEEPKIRNSSPDKATEEPPKEPETKVELDLENDASVDLEMIPLPSDLPPTKIEMPKLDVSAKTIIPQSAANCEIKQEQNFEDIIPLSAIPLPSSPPPSIIMLPSLTPKPQTIEIKDNPKPKDSAPKIKDTSPKAKESASNVKEVSPKVKETSCKIKEIVPKAKETPSKIKESSPKIKEAPLKSKESSPNIKETSPKIKETSPKFKETPPMAKETSPKVKEPLHKVKETSPKVKEISPKVKETSPKAREITPKIKEVSPKAKEVNTKIKLEDIKLPDTELGAESFKALELPSSPLVDTEEDKSEPDSPARMDVLPEPPPGFLLHSEGPKIAEKLLKAINSAKRLSLSPPPLESRPITPKKDDPKPKAEEKISPIPDSSKKAEIKIATTETPKKEIRKTPDDADSIFGEPSKFTDAKLESVDVKKVKPKEPTPPRIDSPLGILERRKSVAEPLAVPGKNNKVLSDTIQKLSSQINQASTKIPTIVMPLFPPADRSDTSDSDDSDRRLIIGALSSAGWGSARGAGRGTVARSSAALAHAGKSPGEWSAGESLLMLEDACKNERKHSASVVVAGSGPSRVLTSAPPGAAEEDSNISLLLCEESIPGSPAPDAEPAPPRHRLHMPFASATLGHHSTEERRLETGAGVVAGAVAEAGEVAEAAAQAEATRGAGGTRRDTLLDNTPPTTPDSSLDMSPTRERRISGQDSPLHRKEEDEENRPNNDASAMEIDKPNVGPRSRKASESSCAGAAVTRRGRRPRRDTDEQACNPTPAPPLKYNFYVDLDPSWDCQRRINVLTSRLADLRKAYHSLKAELAAIDRRRKKLRRKEREAVKAAKAACS